MATEPEDVPEDRPDDRHWFVPAGGGYVDPSDAVGFRGGEGE